MTLQRAPSQAGAGYVMTVKANQPGLLTRVATQITRNRPTTHRQHSRGHGRTEERLIQTTPAAEDIDFPGAAQLARIIRYTGGLDGQRTRKEIVHAITNLPAEHTSSAQLATLIRGHCRAPARLARRPCDLRNRRSQDYGPTLPTPWQRSLLRVHLR